MVRAFFKRIIATSKTESVIVFGTPKRVVEIEAVKEAIAKAFPSISE